MPRWVYFCIFLLNFPCKGKKKFFSSHNPFTLDPIVLSIQNYHAAAERHLNPIMQEIDCKSILYYYYTYFFAYNVLKHKENIYLLKNIADNNTLNTYYTAKSSQKLAQHFFAKKKFSSTIHYHLKRHTIGSLKRNKLYYQLAYAYLSQKDYIQALTYFQKIIYTTSIYQNIAHYYCGCILILQKKYDEALPYFTKLQKMQNYTLLAVNMIAYIYYQKQCFVQLKNFLYEQKDKKKSFLHQKYLAEAHFYLQEYGKAAKNYQQIIKNEKNNPCVCYRLAYSLFKSEEWKKAIKYCEQLISADTIYKQKASYILGLIYIHLNNHDLALGAFQNAYYSGNKDEELTQKALLQCGLITYNQKKFSQAILWFKEWLHTYPLKEKKAFVENILIEAYLQTKNYAIAIQHIEQIEKPILKIKTLYQKITLLYGKKLFIQEQYAKAVDILKKSLLYPVSQTLKLQALFWLGESFSANNQYEKALSYYQDMVYEPSMPKLMKSNMWYSLGYAYFYQENYKQALHHFLACQAKNALNNIQMQDIILRTGDCYYMQKNYTKALSYYEKLVKEQYHLPHVYYYKGCIYAMLKNTTLATKCWETVIAKYSNTIYHEKALWSSANYFLSQSMYKKSIQKLDIYIQKNPYEENIAQALLLQAIAYSNIQNMEAVKKNCEKILSTYPQSTAAENALLELQKITLLAKDTVQWQKYVEMYNKTHPESNSIEKINFEAIKKMFYHQSYSQCIPFAEKFLLEHPHSVFYSNVVFFLGEAYYRLQNYAQALPYYHKIVEHNEKKYYIKTLKRIAHIYNIQQNYHQALYWYKILDKHITQTREKHHNALQIIKMHATLEQHDAVIAQGKGLLKIQPKKNVQYKVLLMLGKAYIKKREFAKAKAFLVQISSSAKKIYLAEAKYFLAYIAYQQKAYDQSLHTLFYITENFICQQYWLEEAYFLIAENYAAKKKFVQAKATLQSIIEHHQSTEKIKVRAKERLKELS